MNIFDSHAHLQDPRIFSNLDQVIERARGCGISKIVCCGSSEDDWEQVASIYEQFPDIIIPAFGMNTAQVTIMPAPSSYYVQPGYPQRGQYSREEPIIVQAKSQRRESRSLSPVPPEVVPDLFGNLYPKALQYKPLPFVSLTGNRFLQQPTHVHSLVSQSIHAAHQGILTMEKEREKANQMKSTREVAVHLCDHVKPHFLEIRNHIDELELYVEVKLWPIPKYREILFNR